MTTGVTSLTSKLYNAKLSAAQPNQPPASSTEKKPAKESEATANKSDSVLWFIKIFFEISTFDRV